jgi:hypothetical protein
VNSFRARSRLIDRLETMIRVVFILDFLLKFTLAPPKRR